jgi:hypothetical protein
MAKHRRDVSRPPDGSPDTGIRPTGPHAKYWNQIAALCLDALQRGEERPTATAARAAEKSEDPS